MKWNDENLVPETSKFLKLKQGENKVRIVSEVGVFGKHWIDKKTIICVGKDKGCHMCVAGNLPKPQWLCWAIDRADNKIKQWEMGYTIIQQIQKLAQSEEYGFDDLPPYDITVIKQGEGLETEYSVIAARKDTPLTEVEQDEIENLPAIPEILEKKKKPSETTSLEPF